MVTSFSNAIIAVILPDRNGSYSYYLTKKSCCSSGCRSLNTDFLFDIMKKNMFNIKKPDKHTCDNKSVVYLGDSSYITSVIWDDFAANPESYIATAYKIQNSIEQYNMTYDLE